MANASDLLKIARIVGNDDDFRERVQAACWLRGVDFNDRVLHRAAVSEAVLAAATLSDDGTTISTEGVPDADIIAVVGATSEFPYWSPNNVSYVVNDRVVFNGTTYTALKNHNSKEGLSPDVDTTNWAVVRSGTGDTDTV